MRPQAEQTEQDVSRALQMQRPNRLPCGALSWAEYRPEVYHLGEADRPVPEGQVVSSADGKRRFTRDGGVWAVGDRERFSSHEDVLALDPVTIEVEEVAPAMVDRMAELLRDAVRRGFPTPMHYGTLVTRATIEFGWEPFLVAAALEPEPFARILERFAQASLAVMRGWARTPGAELIVIHDDIAGTRGLFMSPDWCRRYVFPCYQRLFDAVHEAGRKVLYMSDGNYLQVLDDLMELGPDGLYVETSSMDPGELMARAGRDRLYLIKTYSRAIDLGTPADIRAELLRLRDLHAQYPGMLIYRGGGRPAPGNAEAFERYYQEFLVYV